MLLCYTSQTQHTKDVFCFVLCCWLLCDMLSTYSTLFLSNSPTRWAQQETTLCPALKTSSRVTLADLLYDHEPSSVPRLKANGFTRSDLQMAIISVYHVGWVPLGALLMSASLTFLFFPCAPLWPRGMQIRMSSRVMARKSSLLPIRKGQCHHKSSFSSSSLASSELQQWRNVYTFVFCTQIGLYSDSIGFKLFSSIFGFCLVI